MELPDSNQNFPSLESNGLCKFVYLAPTFDHINLIGSLANDLANYQSVDNHACNVGMGVWFHPIHVLKSVPAIEELTDIPANVLSEYELASRMVELKLRDVQDLVIQNDKFFSSLDPPLELLQGDVAAWRDEGSFSSLNNLVNALHNQDNNNKDADVGISVYHHSSIVYTRIK